MKVLAPCRCQLSRLTVLVVLWESAAVYWRCVACARQRSARTLYGTRVQSSRDRDRNPPLLAQYPYWPVILVVCSITEG